ncbi:MAG: hypothetical protein N3F09_08055 [Bacteroidia bacterium]|nr:hypothetical protein [Bacteroidia bacterium]
MEKIEIKTDSIKQYSGYHLQIYSLDSVLFETPKEKLTHIQYFPENFRNSVRDYIKSFLVPTWNSDTLPLSSILEFTTHKDMKDIYLEMKKSFPSPYRFQLKEKIRDALLRYQACFPKIKIPEGIVFVHSGFNYAFFRSGKNLLCGLDMYLGRNHVFYDYAGFPRYRSRTADKHYLITDIIKACWLIHTDTSKNLNHLLDHMIYKGKMYYLMHLCVPEAPDSILFGYTSKQMQYIEKYEKKLWEHLTEKNKLFDNNLKTIQNYTAEGPFTSAISKECPPYIAHWFGYQIIKQFIHKNPQILPDSLMKITDSKKILFESKFSP